MQLQHDTIFITGGSDGIGLALARALAVDNTVIICGRNAAKLQAARALCPDLHCIPCDITDADQRQALMQQLSWQFPALNVLINNAGAKCRTDLRTGVGVAQALDADLALNFGAPVHLCQALLPLLQAQPRAAVVNFTTGLVHLPKAEQAIYCAAKSALRSYTRSLRWALRETPVQVCEVVLPLVATAFHQGRLAPSLPALHPEQAARRILSGLRRGRTDLHIGQARLARWLSALLPELGLALVNRAHTP